MEIETKQTEPNLFETKIGEQTLLIDTPGAGDRAMSPPQVFIASMNACSMIYINSYCRNAGIDTTGLKVKTEFEKFDGKLGKFKMKITLPNCPEDRRKAVIMAAHKCLIHETLENYEGCEMEIQ